MSTNKNYYMNSYLAFRYIEKDGMDLYRVHHGEPKYLSRELFAQKYPGISVPDKVLMSRPVDK